jgi:phosphoribosylaminoimidazolecarboxamide formyltransferase / IMP cyclohydrolase
MAGMLNALARDESGAQTNSYSDQRAKSEAAEHALSVASDSVDSWLPVRKAIASVYDKSGLDKLAGVLARFDVEVVATEGTVQHLGKVTPQLRVSDILSYTQYPENLNGRLKTLHPKIQAGVLGIRKHHDAALRKIDAEFIDLVIVNLYPFEKTVASGADFFACIENIDIGGPALLRAAAKNHACVAAICDPADYEELIDQMEKNNGGTTRAFRRKCAEKVFEHTARYDAAIARWFSKTR